MLLASNPVEWWKINAERYPCISQLAKYCLSVPASSVPSERIFSTAGQLVSARRNKLLPDNIDRLLFLNKNWKL